MTDTDSTLDLDGGRAPDDTDAEPIHEEPPAATVDRDEKPAVDPDQVAELFDFGGSLLNMIATARGGGPEDVYTFTEKELELLGRAGASYVNRHARLAAIAEKSDVAIVGGVTLKMLKRETGRYRAHKHATQNAGADLAEQSGSLAVRPVDVT